MPERKWFQKSWQTLELTLRVGDSQVTQSLTGVILIQGSRLKRVGAAGWAQRERNHGSARLLLSSSRALPLSAPLPHGLDPLGGRAGVAQQVARQLAFGRPRLFHRPGRLTRGRSGL